MSEILTDAQRCTKISRCQSRLLIFLYCRFCKNAIFQNFGNIIFFCRFAFFSGQLFSAVSRPICTKFGTNVSSWLRFKQARAIFEKLKNQVTTVKKHRNFGQIFIPAVTFSLVVTKRLEIFEKSFRALPLGCYTFQKMSL